MLRVILKLIIDEIRYDRRKAVLEAVLMALAGILVFSVCAVYPQAAAINTAYEREHYGDWYAYADIPDDVYDLVRYEMNRDTVSAGVKYLPQTAGSVSVHSPEDDLHYGWLYMQGEWNGYQIGHVDETLYDLCALRLTDGSLPGDRQIMISEELRDKEGFRIGDTLHLSVNGADGDYVIIGIIHLSQDFFPDICTAEEAGHASLFFDRMFAYADADTQTMYLGTYGLPLTYIENRHGYDHYTMNNDSVRWQKEHTAFNDEKLAQILAFLSAGIFLCLVQTINMRRKAHEYTLLRAAGMTSPQLVAMVLLEICIISFTGILCGLCIMILLTAVLAFPAETFYQWPGGALVLSLLRQPGLLTGQCLLLLMFAAAGAYVPVLRSIQNAFSGSFGAVLAGSGRRHRRKLSFLHVRLLALRQASQKSTTVSMAVFLALLSMTCLSANAKTAVESSGAYQGRIEVRFQKHCLVFYELSEEIPRDLYREFNVETHLDRYGIWQETAQMIPSAAPDKTYQLTGFSAAEITRQYIDSVKFSGRLPETEDEILVNPHQTGAYEITEEGAWSTYVPGVSIGDRIIIQGKAFTVTGLIEPNETVTVRIPHAYASAMPEEAYTQTYEQYLIPETAIAVLPEVMEESGFDIYLQQRLIYDDEEITWTLLSRMVQRGYQPDKQVGVSDVNAVYSSYDQRFLSLHISMGMAVFFLSFALFMFMVLQTLGFYGDRQTFIMLKRIGMTDDQLTHMQLWTSVYTAVLGVLILNLYSISRLVSGLPWSLSPMRFLMSLIIIFPVSCAVHIPPLRYTLYRMKKEETER